MGDADFAALENKVGRAIASLLKLGNIFTLQGLAFKGLAFSLLQRRWVKTCYIFLYFEGPWSYSWAREATL